MSIFSKKKKKKIFYQNTPPSSKQLSSNILATPRLLLLLAVCVDVLGVGDEVVTYEDVAQLESEPDTKRPIILIGAPGVGRRTLIRKLFKHDSSHYAPVVQRKCRKLTTNAFPSHKFTRERTQLFVYYCVVVHN